MNTEKPLTLGWVGVGNMGGPMVCRLRQAGYRVDVCGSGRRDISPFCTETGACLKRSPREVAEGADVIFSMIPNGEILQQIIVGEEGLAKTDFTGKLLVDMSTVDPDSSAEAARLIEKAGGRLLRAPVTGSTHYARDGTLGIMVSGERADFETCLPYLRVLGNRQTYLGQGEAARYMKIVINMMLGHALQSFSEALVLGEKLGLEWDTMVSLIADSAAASPLIRYKADSVRARDFCPTSTGYNMHKDMKMAVDLAQRTNVSLPLTAAAMQMYHGLAAQGLLCRDSSSLILVNERLNGLEGKDLTNGEATIQDKGVTK